MCFLAFLYGALVPTYRLFPYEFLLEAKLGGEALLSTVGTEMLIARPVKFLHFDDEGLTGPTVRFGGGGARGEDLILVGGGPSQLMSHCPDFGCFAWIMDRDGGSSTFGRSTRKSSGAI